MPVMSDVFEEFYRKLVEKRIAMHPGQDVVKFRFFALTPKMTERIATEYQKLGWSVDFEKVNRFVRFTFTKEGAEPNSEDEMVEKKAKENDKQAEDETLEEAID